MREVHRLFKACQGNREGADPLLQSLPLLLGQAKILLLRIDQDLPSSPRDLKILGTLALRIADLLERAA